MNTAFSSTNWAAPCRLTLSDGTHLTEQIVSLTYSAGCSSSTTGPSLGSTVAATFTVKLSTPFPILEGRDVTLEVQTGEDTWAPLGYFRFETPETGDEIVTVTAVDAMLWALEEGYYPATSPPTTALTILGDICDQAGISMGSVDGILDVAVSDDISGYTMREMVGYMASLLGRNAVIRPDGALELIWYSDSGVTVGTDDYYSGSFTRKDYDWILSGLTVSTGTGEEDTLSAGVAGSVISFSNLYMTQTQLDTLWDELQGFSYRPGEVTMLGDLRICPGDRIVVDERSGSSYTLAVMAVEHSYDGGWKSKLTAYGSAETDTNASYTGPLTTAVERYTADVASFKQLYAQDLTVVNGKITNLESQNAELKNLVAVKADIEDLTAANAAIEQLQAADAKLESALVQKAEITDLAAAQADIENLTAETANLETLLAGSAGVGSLQAIHLTGDNVVIDDAIITDAMIASLTASKLTAGTIYTSLVKIASDQNENLLIDGATFQLKDAAGTVRVQIGKDAAGDYSYYLWDAEGNLMWSPTGVTAEGLNDGIIRDVNVAEDAAISGNKLNITSVAQRLNEDGSITVDASKVTIDDSTLDVAYQTVTNNADAAQKAAKAAQAAADAAAQTASDAQTAADQAAQDAATAQATADTAQSAAAAAQSAADTAQADAAAAQSTADAAKVNAATAQSAADAAKTDAEAAQAAADQAQADYDELAARADATDADLAEAQQKLTQAQADAVAAQNAADAAQIAADQAQADAAAAQSTADTAKANAATAQATADTAKTNAAAAQSTADAAKTNAANAQKAAEAAQADADDALAQVATVTTRTTALETSLSVVQGQITSKVWQSDITEVTSPLAEQLTTLEDQYSQIDQTVDGIELSVGNLQTTVTDQGSSISDISAELALKVAKDDNDQIVSMLNASADEIALTGNRLVVDSDYFKLSEDGTLIATNANLSGSVTATDGSIGDWTINAAGISATREYDGLQYRYIIQAPSSALAWYSFLACQYRSSDADDWSYAMRISYDGAIYGQVLDLDGNLTAGGNLTGNYIKSNTYLDAADRIRCSAGSVSIGSGQGVILLNNGDVYMQGSGNLKADGNGAFAGSLSTYGYTVPCMQHGNASVTLTANTWQTATVTFPKAFSGAPDVVLTLRHNSQATNISYKLTALSATGFTAGFYCSGGGTYAFHWIAMYG